jgi:hypothetical protein
MWLHFAHLNLTFFSYPLSNLVSLDAQVKKRRVTTDCHYQYIPLLYFTKPNTYNNPYYYLFPHTHTNSCGSSTGLCSSRVCPVTLPPPLPPNFLIGSLPILSPFLSDVDGVRRLGTGSGGRRLLPASHSSSESELGPLVNLLYYLG